MAEPADRFEMDGISFELWHGDDWVLVVRAPGGCQIKAFATEAEARAAARGIIAGEPLHEDEMEEIYFHQDNPLVEYQSRIPADKAEWWDVTVHIVHKES